MSCHAQGPSPQWAHPARRICRERAAGHNIAPLPGKPLVSFNAQQLMSKPAATSDEYRAVFGRLLCPGNVLVQLLAGYGGDDHRKCSGIVRLLFRKACQWPNSKRAGSVLPDAVGKTILALTARYYAVFGDRNGDSNSWRCSPIIVNFSCVCVIQNYSMRCIKRI